MSEIDLIFEFLKDPRAEVRQLAVDNVLSFTKNQDFVHHFKKNDCAIIKTLALMRKENAVHTLRNTYIR